MSDTPHNYCLHEQDWGRIEEQLRHGSEQFIELKAVIEKHHQQTHDDIRELRDKFNVLNIQLSEGRAFVSGVSKTAAAMYSGATGLAGAILALVGQWLLK
jgi:ferritin-like metal-binding protein YciE